jgi:type I restriction enzyme M protein
MDNETYNHIVSLIWGIADDCLRDVYVRGKYRDLSDESDAIETVFNVLLDIYTAWRLAVAE